MPEQLIAEAKGENARSLAGALGIAEDEAADLLDRNVLISSDPDFHELSFQVETLLARTLSQVLRAGQCEYYPAEAPALEIIMGEASRQSESRTLWVQYDGSKLFIGCDRHVTRVSQLPRGAEMVVAACYIAALAIKIVTDERLPFSPPEPLIIDVADLRVTEEMRQTDFNVTAYLAGAGAIGNAFLWTLREFRPRGVLRIVDFDIVKPGNLNRQIYFSEEDLEKPKADRLALRAQSDFANLRLEPRVCRLQDIPDGADPHWLEELIVGVDSPRARRSLQDELPKRVFDASTTNIEEVVIHLHEQPTDAACMSCIYAPQPAELEHARHVANVLGVGLAEVQSGSISQVAAKKISAKYPGVIAESIIGDSYDTLFKAVCGQEATRTTSSSTRQVLAPFAFVSVLAGALLAIEYVRWKVHGAANYNSWRVSPWAPPLDRLRKRHPRIQDCVFCRDPVVRDYIRELWGAETSA